MTDKKKEPEKDILSIEREQIEHTRMRFFKDKDGKVQTATPFDENGKPECAKKMTKELVGVKDMDITVFTLIAGQHAISTSLPDVEGLNLIIQSLNDMKPADSFEARLITQAVALFQNGMINLSKSETQKMLDHSNHYLNKATKLLRLHNETIEALSRYRRGGEQKISVSHSVIAGQAVVNNFNGIGGGEPVKNRGEKPCSEPSAVQKPEPMVINHVDSPQWQMEGADFMEEKIAVPRQMKVDKE